jgi:hypothetical protein
MFCFFVLLYSQRDFTFRLSFLSDLLIDTTERKQ